MLIRYNGTNIHALGHLGSPGAAATQAPMSIHPLRPGWNEFPKEVWDQYQNDPEIQKWIKEGKLELMAEKVVVKDGRKKSTKIIGTTDDELNIMDLPEAKAIEVVKATYNREMLQRWIDEENRHKVKRVLTKQIEPLLNSESNDDDDEEDEE